MSLKAHMTLVAVTGLLLTNTALAHPEHEHDGLTMNFYVHQNGAQVEALVRTPLTMFQNVGLPLHGPNYVDTTAFYEIDPHAEGDATYAERAANAVNKAFTISFDDRELVLETREVRVAPPHDTSFDSFETAAEKITLEAEPHQNIDQNHGYIDTLLAGELPEPDAELSITPLLAIYGHHLTISVHYLHNGESVRAFHIHGDSRNTPLDEPAQ